MMKKVFVFFFLAQISAFAVSEQGLLPEDRVAAEIADNERNPFGLNVPKTEVAKPKVVNEEARIRDALDSFSISGIMQGESGTKVLFGPLVLEKGEAVSPVIPNQTESLTVLEVSEKNVELGFVEADGNVGTRKVFIKLDMRPGVQFKLGKKGGGGKLSGFDGVITKDEPVTQQ